jgi:hypothetical protein
MSDPKITWVDEEGESFAEVGGLLLVVWPEEGRWDFQVQQGDDVLAEFAGCFSLGEATLACAMWGLGYLRGSSITSAPLGSTSTTGPSVESSPPPSSATDCAPSDPGSESPPATPSGEAGEVATISTTGHPPHGREEPCAACTASRSPRKGKRAGEAGASSSPPEGSGQ